MEFDVFKDIRDTMCASDNEVTEGKMMSSPAIHYKNKVFAFFSRNNTMVFKFGRNYPIDELGMPIREFNPFKKKGPLRGWYEVDHTESDKWLALAAKALKLIERG